MTSDSFSRIQISCLEARPQSIRLRQNLFHSLHAALKSSEKTIKSAIAEDTSHDEWETSLEYTLAISELREHYSSLDLEQDLKRQKSVEDLQGTTNVGIVYIIPSKQNQFYSVISALTAALAAGNCVVLELPTTLTQVSAVLRAVLPKALDADIFAIIGDRISKENLSKCHVLDQTGIIPASLRDGGNDSNSVNLHHERVVAVVDRSANIPDAASIICASRAIFNGQSVYSPALVLVNEFVADDFLFHLAQAIISPMHKQKDILSKSSHPSMGGPNGHSQIKTEFESKDNLNVIISGENGSIVEIKDRTQVLVGRQIDSRVISIYRITSLDDAIDLCNGFQTPLEASYVFAAVAETNYLSRFIDARISCINHIPCELMVGPFAPEHPTIAPSPSPRYSPALFRLPRPRFSHASQMSILCLKSAISRSTKVLDPWSRPILQTALPAIKQGDGNSVGFFDQAFIMVGITFASVIAGGAFTLYQLSKRHWLGY
ncbi:Aldehyde/histidinol dehydrogenase [Talaromyces proteolyticus]|uniref:Aldehyde/histidinol dehydrogenase n=1 Tax=Talaromyces proteolyticus TaxID=1131652 RepID=A0AAD4KQU6_9EURO|nr:Aldehyde/histidinol dehydrogenase [Talaromyces proteolyticus]KAH8696272.1 Aldehyde/histidinol dehydrogenase [Talaromyces proteolyticus]